MIKKEFQYKVIYYLKKKLKYFYFLFFSKEITKEDKVIFSYLSERQIFQANAVTLIDIGANVGIWTSKLLDKICSNSNLLVFEPLPKANRILSKKFKSAIKSEQLVLFDCALSNSKGKTKFQLFNDDPLSPASNISKTADHIDHSTYNTIDVSINRLDDLIEDRFDNNRVVFIKIDVEGHELEVVLGGLETIKLHKPILYIEILREKWNKNSSSSELCDLLKNIGYEIMQVDGEKIIKISSSFVEKSENFLFMSHKKI